MPPKSEESKDNFKTIDIKINKKKGLTSIEVTLKVVQNETPKDFCEWYEQFMEVKEIMPLDTATKQIKVIHSILAFN